MAEISEEDLRRIYPEEVARDEARDEAREAIRTKRRPEEERARRLAWNGIGRILATVLAFSTALAFLEYVLPDWAWLEWMFKLPFYGVIGLLLVGMQKRIAVLVANWAAWSWTVAIWASVLAFKGLEVATLERVLG